MAKESILDPEIDLIKTNEFYLFYEMMMQSLKTNDVKEGINKSLYMLRTFLESGNIAIFRKNRDNHYVYKMSDLPMNDIIKPVSSIVNKSKELIEKKEILDIDLNISESLETLKLIYISVTNNTGKDECIISIANNNKEKELEPKFWERAKETMQVILKRAASYERNIKAVTTDLLTGLDNRNSYELRKQQLEEEDANLVFGIFDLFRLKYINDNYTHNQGDLYIKEAARILNKYWPKKKTIVNNDGTETIVETGHCVYRIGGDEFVLLTTVEDVNMTGIKAKLASDEASMIDLETSETFPVGINYGIVNHNPGEYLKETLLRADTIMQNEKNNMYKKYKLERRR